MAKKQFGVHCAVTWCVCLAKKKSQYCAVHAARGKDYQTTVAGTTTAPDLDCDGCDGTGDCADCDGDGTHLCGRGNCHDEHDCGTCEGTGQCPACHRAVKGSDDSSFDARYLAFAFDPGWVPPVLITYPWEEA